jgi:GDSL-like Lipase/Acylhydrolase family
VASTRASSANKLAVASTTAADVSPKKEETDACAPLEVDIPELITTPINPPVPDIEDPSNQALGPLFERLATLLRGEAKDHVRFAMYGDSNMTKDFITGEMRRTLQKRYGDAGHGYLAAGQPWTWYKHMDVEHWIEPRGWKSYAVSTHSVPDHAYGFAGIAAESTSIRARIRMTTAPAGAPVGTKVSRLQLFYLQRPHGSPFDVLVDGAKLGTVQTASDSLRTGMQWFDMDDGPHSIEFKAGGPNVRLFGAALERTRPGIVVDSLGVGGATVNLLDRMNRDIARTALQQRKYDLVMILTGGTEDDNDAHDAALEQFIALHREALPNASILILSPIDFAYGGRAHPKPARRIGRLAVRKRRVALDHGCAYWDFYAAMGGEMSIVTFASHRLAWNDLVHLTESGGAFMGRRIVHVLWKAFARYVEDHPRAGCVGAGTAG